VIVSSIDIVGGQVVQLVGGEELTVEAGDPRPLLQLFSRVGEVAVIDIDAARGEGDNRALIQELCRTAPVRVGGGIRDVATAIEWLDAGASKIIIGTAADRDLLAALPRDRVIVAVDARDGLVVTDGWRTSTDRPLLQAIEEWRELCGGFLVTFVEREGRLAGTDLDLAARVVEAAGGVPVTIAGGITTAEEIAVLDALGADAQVGMAIYTGRLGLGEAFAAPLVSDRPDGLWATVVADEDGAVLGLTWSDLESLDEAIRTGTGIYRSRTRGRWVKGASSGATQELLSVAADCDRDALLFTVRQHGPGFCHLGTHSCWGEGKGSGRMERRISRISTNPSPGSNTARLLGDRGLLAAKLVEEARELGAADSPGEVVAEAADLLYFLHTKLASAGVRIADVHSALEARERQVTRRPMAAREEK
jgi:phosphoribosyl-AMP cyclohydrolase / phosphoribosyl-ATP pyrophosphohydrolase